MSMAQEQPIRELSAADLDAKIHELTAIQILQWFEKDTMTAGQMQCVLRFLKDNDITALPIPESALERIKGKLTLPYPRMSDATDETSVS